ncbi:acylneuraminate cytidylyltransferase family protein [Vibrio metschnikovii]|nr:acylneuraminate cytidylyltransferase family protein [Vibrio metschnikovii]
MNDERVALITARGGSKGLPRKNILPLHGIPLIAWTIRAAINTISIDRVIVSTDDEEIATISKSFGAEVIDRPSELATDTASSMDVIAHAIFVLDVDGRKPKDIVLLQPTSPLRTSEHIENAVSIFYEKNADGVISVFEPSYTPIKSYIENTDGSIEGLYSREAPYLRRQDLPRAFQPNGAIYIFSVNEFIKNNTFPKKNVFPYIMSIADSIDIDTFEDLRTVEKILKER